MIEIKNPALDSAEKPKHNEEITTPLDRNEVKRLMNERKAKILEAEKAAKVANPANDQKKSGCYREK